MSYQGLSQDKDARKVEATLLVEHANRQYEEALIAYQKARDIYQEIGEQVFATLISHLIQGNISNVSNTQEFVSPVRHTKNDQGIWDNPPIINGPK
ncbi:hypothetical protein [Iningainema tapete]|uniref:Uncharacterized protein n=1 Tax=Iningainema tapete BLCC-T55 TaxID=2748662 RepID=A0A8J7C7K6_9CYAN|nr:hypothetical protein [Iningainema tapete]MBD2773296.1 hypothetical protein [Iningainema tapete BLCC-T55]